MGRHFWFTTGSSVAEICARVTAGAQKNIRNAAAWLSDDKLTRMLRLSGNLAGGERLLILQLPLLPLKLRRAVTLVGGIVLDVVQVLLQILLAALRFALGPAEEPAL